MKPLRLLSLVFLAAASCAQAPVRRLAVVDEMPPLPEQPSESSPAGDFVTFYPGAASDEEPQLSRYAIQCSERLADRSYFTLAMRDDGRAALFVLTLQRVTDLSRTVACRGGKIAYSPWGFAYDRNGDGWADYFTVLTGTHPIETPDVAALVPKRPIPAGVRRREGDPSHLVTADEAKLMWAHARPLFLHHADDDFDGGVDALVSGLEDPERWGWIYRRAVFRSRSHSQVVDEDWTFLRDIAVREGPVPREPDGSTPAVVVYSSGKDVLGKASRWLSEINAGLRACRLPRGALPRE